MDGMFDFDILKGARHVYKPPPPPKPQRLAQKPSMPSKHENTQVSTKCINKSMVVKKPQPLSFEEMMKLASKNMTNNEKLDKPSKPQPPPPKPLPSVPKSSTPSVPSKHGNSQVATKSINKSMAVKKPQSVGFGNMMKLASKNLNDKFDKTSKSQPPPPKPQRSSQKPSTSSFPLKRVNTQVLTKSISKSMAVKKPQGFEDMMKLASKNMTNNDKLSKSSKPQPPSSKPLRSVPKSSTSSMPSKHGNSHVATKSINKSMVIKKPQPVGFQHNIPPKHLIKDDRTLRPPKRPRYDYEDDDDSMDDFIVDDEEENVQKELKKVLRNYYRSDESVWQQREKEIDLSKMNARYQDIDAEEKRSYRIARMEDMIEEKRGSKALQ